LFYFYKHNFSYITNNTVNKNKIGIIAVNIDSFDNIYIRLFILHEPYDLLWPLSGRILGKNMYYCALSIYFFKRKINPPRYQI